MKNTRKFLTVIVMAIVIASMCIGLAACNGGSEDFTVGICQLVQHEALDEATRGFVDALTSELAKEGKTVKIITQNAQGDATVCPTIVNSFVSQNVDLIMANATASLQSAANATTAIPILGTSITDYGVALEIDNFSGTVGGNISGTSDLAPLIDQALMFNEVIPDKTNIGLLFCSAEPNSEYQVRVVEEKLIEMGKTTRRFTFSDSNDINAVINQAVEWADALYIPTDNTAASNATLIDSVCRNAGIPIVAGEEGICKKCGIVTLSISYYNIGVKTGEMAAQILLGKADISSMAIAYDANPVKKFNKTICDELGITVPQGYEEIVM